MSGNDCSCAGPPAPAAASSAATPCGDGAQVTEVVWETLALAASATQVSHPFSARGANALDIVILTINGAGAIQTLFQTQGSNDGFVWTNLGASGQSTAVGFTVMGPITGNSYARIRVVAVNQVANITMFTVILRLFCG